MVSQFSECFDDYSDEMLDVEIEDELPELAQQHYAEKVWMTIGTCLIVFGILVGTLYGVINADPSFAKSTKEPLNLSDGSHHLKSDEDLHELSWHNGLAILEALDRVNGHLTHLQRATDSDNQERNSVVLVQKELRASVAQVNALLHDRKKLAIAAETRHIDDLYTPVFREYLKETRHNLMSHEVHYKIVE